MSSGYMMLSSDIKFCIYDSHTFLYYLLGKALHKNTFIWPFVLPHLTHIYYMYVWYGNIYSNGASLIAHLVKNLPVMQETPVWFWVYTMLILYLVSQALSWIVIPIWEEWH